MNLPFWFFPLPSSQSLAKLSDKSSSPRVSPPPWGPASILSLPLNLLCRFNAFLGASLGPKGLDLRGLGISILIIYQFILFQGLTGYCYSPEPERGWGMGWENGTDVQKIQTRGDSPEWGRKLTWVLDGCGPQDEGLRQGKETEMLGCPKGWICGCHEATPGFVKRSHWLLSSVFCIGQGGLSLPTLSSEELPSSVWELSSSL